MPIFLPPHKSGVHRIAAIALFRALLQQCKALQSTLPTTTTDQLQNLVRHRFKSQRHVTSHRQLKVGFAAGYEAIDHLDAAVAGDQSRTQVLLDLLSQAPESVKRAPKNETWERWQRQEKRKAAGREEYARRAAAKEKFFQRPLPLEQISGGVRRIPVLINANHVPVLRIKKPQPLSLSKYLNSRIKQRQGRHDRRWELEELAALGRAEDRWDALVFGEYGIREGSHDGRRGGKWESFAIGGLKEVQGALMREKEKNRDMAVRMQGLVDRELEMRERERGEKRRVRNRGRMRRRREKAGAEDEKGVRKADGIARNDDSSADPKSSVSGVT